FPLRRSRTSPYTPLFRSAVDTETRAKVQKPSLYRVLILNDDYTPMEFVVYVLERFFNKSREDVTRIMLHVHQHGVGVCGVFTYEVAETKVAMGVETARDRKSVGEGKGGRLCGRRSYRAIRE